MGQSQQPQSIQASELQQWLQSERPSPQLVDVREEAELAIAAFPGAVLHRPLSQSNEWLGTLQADLKPDTAVVVVCHAGVRSYHFGLWLLDQPWGLEVWNLEGGIDAWSLQVDPSVPRY